MKFIAVTLLAMIAAVAANPINVSDNNVGDIVSVDIDANLVLRNEVNQNIISIIIALLGQGDGEIQWPRAPELRNISPEMIEKIRKLMPKKN